MGQIVDFFEQLFSADNWPARWHIGTWTELLGWMYIGSNLAIGAAFFVIAMALVQFLRKKPHLRIPPVYFLFGAFILFNGITSIMDAILFFWPAYRLNAFSPTRSGCSVLDHGCCNNQVYAGCLKAENVQRIRGRNNQAHQIGIEIHGLARIGPRRQGHY